MAEALELATQLAVVVDLAVVHQPQRAVVARERLHAGVAEVDDREPAEAERDAFVVERAVAVGPAMVERGGHLRDRRSLRRTAECDDPAQTAHRLRL